jgi:hypothetical protein
MPFVLSACLERVVEEAALILGHDRDDAATLRAVEEDGGEIFLDVAAARAVGLAEASGGSRG